MRSGQGMKLRTLLSAPDFAVCRQPWTLPILISSSDWTPACCNAGFSAFITLHRALEPIFPSNGFPGCRRGHCKLRAFLERRLVAMLFLMPLVTPAITLFLLSQGWHGSSEHC